MVTDGPEQIEENDPRLIARAGFLLVGKCIRRER
jgi:hypothetical protein